MGIPDNYKVLFLQGGASQQFSAIPFNLTQPGDTVDHVSTLRSWASLQAREHSKRPQRPTVSMQQFHDKTYHEYSWQAVEISISD